MCGQCLNELVRLLGLSRCSSMVDEQRMLLTHGWPQT